MSTYDIPDGFQEVYKSYPSLVFREAGDNFRGVFQGWHQLPPGQAERWGIQKLPLVSTLDGEQFLLPGNVALLEKLEGFDPGQHVYIAQGETKNLEGGRTYKQFIVARPESAPHGPDQQGPPF